MDVWRILLLLCCLVPYPAAAQQTLGQQPGPNLCRPALAATERATGVPDRLMQAIGVVESGRKNPAGGVTPWPWTINVEGVGAMFETKQAAIDAVNAHRARGARSIDVGCMQVNLMHHAGAFASLEEAFDPAANARYAARFLQQLLNQTGSWPLAVAGYHSLTPDIGADYAKKVLAVWAHPEFPAPTARSAPPPPPPPGLGLAEASAAPTAALPSSMPARVMPIPGGGAPTFTNRGLDAYRAMPTRLATTSGFKRS